MLAESPFGAFGLAVDLADDEGTLLNRVVTMLTAGDEPPVVFVDDAHHLDDASVSVLSQLATDGEIRIAVTVQPAVDGRSPHFRELVADGLLHHVLLDPLHEDDVTAMLEHHLGGVVSRGVIDATMFLTMGVPVRVLELLRYARQWNRFRLRHGVWLLDGLDIAYDERVRDVISYHLARYSDEQRGALELVVLAGEVEVELMLSAGYGEAADDLVAAGVIGLESRGSPVYVALESHSTETIRVTVPVGRSRRMFELVESAPGTPSQRSRMLRADWGLSCGARISLRDSIDAARIAIALGEWHRALRILRGVPFEAMDPQELFDLGRLYCDVNLVPVGLDILARTVRRAQTPFLVLEAFIVWIFRDVGRESPSLSVDDFLTALDRIAAAADGDAEVLAQIDLTRVILDRVSRLTWARLSGDDVVDARWMTTEEVPETLRVSIAIAFASKELERGRGEDVLDLLEETEAKMTTIGTPLIMLDCFRTWAMLQAGRRNEVRDGLSEVRSQDLAFLAASSGPRDLVLARILGQEGRWAESARRAAAAVEAFEYWNQQQFMAFALAQAEYSAMMSGNAEAADDFDARFVRLPVANVYLEGGRARGLRLVARAVLTGEQSYLDALAEVLAEAEAEEEFALAMRLRLELLRHFGLYDAEAILALAAAAGERDRWRLGSLGAALRNEDPEALTALADDLGGIGPDLAERCREIAESWREEPPTHPHRVQEEAVELTNRERQISRLIVAGLSNAEIAEELGVAVRTVEGHTYRMYRKLDITSRSEVAEALSRLRTDRPG
ncbi:helix-turn-helix transcriptional regulator [Brevibacterium metallidurans]|uniref:HTH luxR-type domain-containing protein n=1 Tax=Brevibacterium metallidurans TaxID=1482676 RepID=A0ABN0SIL3_9MICO